MVFNFLFQKSISKPKVVKMYWITAKEELDIRELFYGVEAPHVAKAWKTEAVCCSMKFHQEAWKDNFRSLG